MKKINILFLLLFLAIPSMLSGRCFNVTDSIAVAAPDTIFKLQTINNKAEIKYLKYHPISSEDRGLLITYYKSILSNGNSGEHYAQAYDAWKAAFVSDTNRNLELFIDGVAIISGCYAHDTARHIYDRLYMLKDEIMELYELAIADVDALNSQLDTEKNKDTLSVAKLRAQQMNYYRNLVQIDSIFNSSHHNVHNKENEQYWENIIFKDSLHISYMYPRYREILSSKDNNVNMVQVAHFVKILYFKLVYDTKNLPINQAKELFVADRELVNQRMPGIISNASKIDTLSNGMTVAEYYEGLAEGSISSTLLMCENAFISSDDYDRLEEYYSQRLHKDGPKVWQDILNSPLSKSGTSVLYFDALVHQYLGDEAEYIKQSGPTFELALKIAGYAHKLKKYDYAKDFYNKVFLDSEFFEKTPYEQAVLYLRMYAVLEEAKQSETTRYSYVKKAQEACPEYPEPYYLESVLLAKILSNAGAKSEQARLLKGLAYIAVYELRANVVRCIEALSTMPDSDIKTKLDKGDMTRYMSQLEYLFPSSELLHSYGLKEGTNYKIPQSYLGKKYTVKIRKAKFREE